MNWYIADTHFGHERVIDFDHRPFANVEEMDQKLIEGWNRRVDREDHVYILGDFAYRNTHPEEWYLKQLKGRKHLILGNHDAKLQSNEEAMAYFESSDKMLHVTDGGNQICLCHYPIAEWYGYHKGHYLIYGHIHNRRDDTFLFMSTRERALNAGCMINHYVPASFSELILNNLEYKQA